ncbi:FAD-binding oxidoreductase [Ktedonosporobacter rubrisoli]|uniref:FAD-binding oxidoreductase n=1 Tax=Ktedonosporobacter rubrisoli TaxID=2509675 RepID=A0A4P6K4G0_KTERU|nr:FAD-binding oxidoreductase [Ktedonosporobacter rubrisoli]QBD83119.1 FAD-binding oxidoreductase [Ktedonosporobacter rubrisoli]
MDIYSLPMQTDELAAPALLRQGDATGKVHTEILIIGGGIAGTSTAYFLAQQGHDVILVERGEIASGASGLNAGIIWANGWGDTPDLPSTLSMGSLEILQYLQLDLGYDLEFRQCGALQAIQTEEEFHYAQGVVKNLQAQHYKTDLLPSKDARCLEPDLNARLLGCIYYPLGACAHPVKTTRILALLAQQCGTRILRNHEVATITYEDNETYRVTTSRGTVQAETLVIATGAWSQHIGAMLGLNIPIYAVRGQMWSTGPIHMHLFHALGAVESTLYWQRHTTTPPELTQQARLQLTRHFYGWQMRNGEIIIGGDQQLAGTEIPDKAGIESNRKHAIELLPFLQGQPVKRCWIGWVPFTPQLIPIIGNISLRKNLYILSGLRSSGFEQGPMAGKLLAECIHNRATTPILAAADPEQQISLLPT